MKALFVFLLMSVLSAQAQQLPDASVHGIDTVKRWARLRVQEAERSFRLKREPSPSYWGQQIVYQIQVDRFNNGDPSNDFLNIEDFQAQYQAGPNLFGLPSYRHGGDLKGISQRLAYLKDLGITSLWLTPVFKHNGSYHGYCTTDFTEIDPGFGTKVELRSLVSEAHKLGMKVVLDIVVNHMCNKRTTYRRAADHYKCADELNAKNWKGEAGGSIAQGELAFGDDFFAPFKHQSFFNRCGANASSDTEGTGPAAIYGDFVSSMLDFDTRNQNFQEIFTELHKYWIAYADVDGFRMDAVKHVTEDFIAYFSTHIRDYAQKIGKKNFFIIGEVAGPEDWIGHRLGIMFSNPHNPNQHGHIPQTLTERMWGLKDLYLKNPVAPYPGLNAVYDFAHGGTALAVLLGQAPTRSLENYFRSSYFNTIAHQNDYRLSWNLLEIHDWPRFASRDKNNMARSMLGVSYLTMAEGSPIIYYGQEQGFNGDCHFHNMNAGAANAEIKKECAGHGHELYRQDMFINGPYRLGSTVPEINRLAYIGKMTSRGSVDWKRDPYLNRSHPLYQLTRKLIHIRRSCSALSFGRTTFRWADNHANGLLAFSRIDENHEALVVINTGAYEFRLPNMRVTHHRSQVWMNLLNSGEVAQVNGHGEINLSHLSIRPYSIMVFVPSSLSSDYNSYLQTHLCKDNL